MRVQIRDLQIGDRVDLENDRYANPNIDHPLYEFEMAVVSDVAPETPTCTAVTFEDGTQVGFPPNWYVEIDTRDSI